MSGTAEKRKKIALSREETDILKWLFIKTLIPVVVIILISSAVLFLGLESLIRKVSFGNYGMAPGVVMQNVSSFISAYAFIAVINILLMLSLSVLVIYATLRNVVLPIMRISREIRLAVETKTKPLVVVRKTDRLLVPLVEGINSLLRIASF
jgi:hypothetical protein